MKPEAKKSSAVVLAHHWLVTYRGGEKVLEEFCRIFPDAKIATLVAETGEIPPPITSHKLICSPLQKIPCAARFYKALLPLHPWALRRLKVPMGTKVVLSSDASMVKGLALAAGIQHICYCHSPPRYLWDMQAEYLKNAKGLGLVGRWVFDRAVPYARRFDHAAARRVNHFIANSAFVAKRIKEFYQRDSHVIYPPVSVDDFAWNRPSEDFYLLVTQLVPYKRADLAVRAFTALNKPLIVIGQGSELDYLRSIAGPSIKLLGRQPFVVVKDHFERCRAFLYPQIEDFGITAVEAQAAGKPVIAFRGGGALETVIEGETGVFFEEQTAESLSAAVLKFEAQAVSRAGAGIERMDLPVSGEEVILTGCAASIPFHPALCRKNAERFRPERFRAEIIEFIAKIDPAIIA